MRLTRLVVSLLVGVTSLSLVAGLTACASNTSSSPGTPRRVGDLITRAELDNAQAPDLHQAIQRLRPNWLHSRGPVSLQSPDAGNVLVYLDDTRLGGIETLSNLQPAEVLEVRRLSAADATSRWGVGHAGGAILVRRLVGGGSRPR
jgi:hypothetical protein